MPLTRRPTTMEGLSIIEPAVMPDPRGYFTEVWNGPAWAALGIDITVAQINQSGSERNVVRGLHFQIEPPMGKVFRVIRGAAFLVAVDLRVNSPTLGRWFGVEASDENRLQLWGGPGFARGFCALSAFAEVQYLCTATYAPAGERGILWNDPDIAIEWPVTDPILSDRDRSAPSLRAWLDSAEAGVLRCD